MRADPLVDVASRIADGQVFDWPDITSQLSTPEEQDIAGELEGLSRIAAAHRQLHQVLPADMRDVESGGARASWGHLELLEVVGRGSYGTVYRAWDMRLERQVALKLFHRAPDPDAVMREGRLLARVRHENVVTVHGADIIDGVAGIWMEFVHGRSLDQLVKERGPFTARDASAIGADVARALAAIHRAHLLHCDVKAQNVVREESGRVVLMDLGAGRVVAETAADERLSDVTGTPRYMAPELFAANAVATSATDLYSLGVLMYYLVSGRFPVEGKTLADLRQAHAEGRAVPLERVAPTLPSSYTAVVGRALDPAADRRPASADEMQSALAAIARPRALFAPWPFWAAAAVAASLVALVMWRTRPTEAPGPATRSIAVVPIRNLTGDPAKAFLADGLTEVLIANLARVRALRVPSFGAVASLRGKDEQPADVAKKLGVQLLLAGSITQADSKFRMSVQLIDPKSGQALWGEELVREVPGMIPAQAEVARLVAERLSLTLSADEQRALGARVIDPRAQEVYLRGLALRTTLPTARDDAARLFREATEVDPLFADAWAQLALVEVALANASANADPLTRSRMARQMAERAIGLDPSDVAAYAAIGTIQFYDEWNFAAAEQTFRTALLIDPSDGFVQQRFSMLLAARGRLDEATMTAQEAVRVEPLVPIRRTSLGAIRYYARDFAGAEAAARQALVISPDFPTAYFELGLIAAARGRYDEAAEDVRQALARSDYMGWQIDLARIYATAGRTAEKERLLASLSERQRAGEGFGIDNLAYIAAAEGRMDDAFGLLNQAVDRRTANMLWILVDPRVDRLRTDPRFEQLVARTGLRQ
jgi:serine/threonine-protein kinase